MRLNDNFTLVIGASENPERYSNIAIKRLRSNNHPVYGLGLKPGKVLDVKIQTVWPSEDIIIDTITLYVSPKHLEPYLTKILNSSAKRIIFNPGTEYPTFAKQCRDVGIETIEACTLVMLATEDY